RRKSDLIAAAWAAMLSKHDCHATFLPRVVQYCFFMMLLCCIVQDDEDIAAFLRLVGRRVRMSREAGGLTQSKLERDSGLRPATRGARERGEQDLEVYALSRVAGALGVALRALLPSDEEIIREARGDSCPLTPPMTPARTARQAFCLPGRESGHRPCN